MWRSWRTRRLLLWLRPNPCWRRRIETGQARSITDLSEQEGVTDVYVCCLLPLTCLAPDIVEAILDGRQPKGLRLADVGEWAVRMGGAARRLGFLSELCAVRLAQDVAALHLAPAGLLNGLHDLPPVLMPAVTLGMVLQPAIDELGGPFCEAVFLYQSVGRLPRCLSQAEPIVLRNQPALFFAPFTKTITAIESGLHNRDEGRMPEIRYGFNDGGIDAW